MQLTSKQQLELDAGLAAGYKMVVRNVREQPIVYANDIHFHPLTNFAQALQLVTDLKLAVGFSYEGVSVATCGGVNCFDLREDETKTQTICRAIVKAVANEQPFTL